LRFLEGSICWLRDEALKLAAGLEEVKKANIELKREVDVLSTENMYLKEYAQCTKRQNMRLEKTVV
jgi:cell division protein FtsB